MNSFQNLKESEDQFDKQVLKDHRSFTQIALQQYPNWKPYADELQGVFNKCVWRYMQDCEVTDKMFPQQYAYEMYRMKRYEPNGVDEFHDHVDVGNHESAKRFLVFFYILTNHRVVKQISHKGSFCITKSRSIVDVPTNVDTSSCWSKSNR